MSDKNPDPQQLISIVYEIQNYQQNYQRSSLLSNRNENNVSQIIYSGETLRVVCYKSLYVFSSGGYLQASWKNGTTKLFTSQYPTRLKIKLLLLSLIGRIIEFIYFYGF